MLIPRKDLKRPGVRCGHGALCVASGVPMEDILKVLPKGWVNIPMMKQAIFSVRDRITEPGEVVMIQWLGPWMDPRVPPGARCKYRHWIARRGDRVWDINSPGNWIAQDFWEKTLPSILMPDRAIGWEESRSLKLNPLTKA